jgi:hypothetical protein
VNAENSHSCFVKGSMRLAAKLLPPCFCFVLAQAVNAASIDVTQPGNGVPPIVVVSGTLANEDTNIFKFKTTTLPAAAVIFNSDGGSLAAGIGIGEVIRMKGFVTLVVDGGRCASACAIAWLGGARRFMSKLSLVGFHSASVVRGNAATESGAANAVLGAYLNSIGLSPAAIWYVTEASPQSMNWLTLESAAQHGIAVELIDASPTSAQSTPPTQPAQGYVTSSLEKRTSDLVAHMLSADEKSRRSVCR